MWSRRTRRACSISSSSGSRSKSHPGASQLTAAEDNAGEQLNQQIVLCERCPRLRSYCADIGRQKRRAFADWSYWARPVPNFGRLPCDLLIVGLAPAAHGANRTGRMFTGDRSGDWLYRALHRAGLANQPRAEHAEDGLTLQRTAITAVCHCAPPQNKPLSEELAACREWLERTIDIARPQVFLALGQIAFRELFGVLRARRLWTATRLPTFGHGASVELVDGRAVFASYHPSQQNTFTGKLTERMLDDVLGKVVAALNVKGRVS
jgi:uracil-DNA glycosylase